MIRHMFSLSDNDPTKSLCGGEGLVRMTDTNVNCPLCLSILAQLRGE